MTTAFVLINCDLSQVKSVVKKLEEINSIEKVEQFYSAYDIMVTVHASSSEELRNILFHDIRKIFGIRATLTLWKVEK